MAHTSGGEPPFVPRDGQVDFTDIRRAPVLNCVVMFQGKILLVRRSEGMRTYPGLWNGISGYLDEPSKSVGDKAFDELREELGIPESDVLSMREGEPFEQEDEEHEKTWLVHPVLVEIATDEIMLDWEADEFAWVSPEEAHQYDLVPGFDKVLDAFSF